MADDNKPNDILDYWASLGNEGWWVKNLKVDQEIHERFGKLHTEACNGKLDLWRASADGALALIIVLDQFSRNMFRGNARSFTQDNQALEIAKSAIDAGLDAEVREDLKVFFYLPFEHAETIFEQEKSVLYQYSIGNLESIKAALEHREIIQRFGRFPHRNPALGRHTTPAEQAFLDDGGFKG
ncbi:MAG: DUF924 family protein [Rhizobiaceae bacterium]